MGRAGVASATLRVSDHGRSSCSSVSSDADGGYDAGYGGYDQGYGGYAPDPVAAVAEDGAALVADTFDFGRKNGPPANPELVDWLA